MVFMTSSFGEAGLNEPPPLWGLGLKGVSLSPLLPLLLSVTGDARLGDLGKATNEESIFIMGYASGELGAPAG